MLEGDGFFAAITFGGFWFSLIPVLFIVTFKLSPGFYHEVFGNLLHEWNLKPRGCRSKIRVFGMIWALLSLLMYYGYVDSYFPIIQLLANYTDIWGSFLVVVAPLPLKFLMLLVHIYQRKHRISVRASCVFLCIGGMCIWFVYFSNFLYNITADYTTRLASPRLMLEFYAIYGLAALWIMFNYLKEYPKIETE